MYNLKRLGGGFLHAYSSTDWKKSKKIEYLDSSKLSISIDHFEQADFAWLCESKSIIPQQYAFAKNNYKLLKNIYKFIFTHDADLINLDNSLFKYVPACGYWIKDARISQKSKMVSFITSNKTMCEGHRFRLKWKERLEGNCDLFGRGFREIQNKEEGLQDYYFSVAIENGKYDTYFTEKILDCFATGTIPIYYGTEKICDFFNKDGIIFLSDDFDIKNLTVDLYESKKAAIIDNFERVLNYDTVEDWMYENHFKNNL